MGLILDVSPRNLEKVLYFASYIVLEVQDGVNLQPKQILSEAEYQEARKNYGDGFRAGMGAESIMELLKAIDLEKDAAELKAELVDATGQKRAAGVRQCLAQIVEHLLERFDREGVAAAGGVEHVLAGKVLHRAQAGRLGRFGKAFFRHADDAVRRGILLDAAALAAGAGGLVRRTDLDMAKLTADAVRAREQAVKSSRLADGISLS